MAVYVFVNLKLNRMLPSAGSCGLNQPSHSNPVEDFLYRPLMHFKFASKATPQVQVVTLSSPSEPASVLSNVCRGREFLAVLMRQLAKDGAKVIAIDKYFSNESCLEGKDQERDQAFRAALLGISSHVVLGQSTHRRDRTKSEDDCLVADPELTLPGRDASDAQARDDPSQKVSFGLTRLNENSLRIPLQWWIFKNDQDAENLNDPADGRRNGFALQAAEALDPMMAGREDLRNLLSRNEHPYGSFSDDIPKARAMDILCADPDSRREVAAHGWGTCADHPEAELDYGKKVVVIGQLVDLDRPSFIGGEEYGLYLQAAYTSDLLGGSYVLRVPTWIDVCMLFALAGMPVLIDYCFPMSYSEPRRALLALLATFVVFIVFGLIAFWFYRRFASISFLTMYGVLGTLIARAFTLLLDELKKRRISRSAV